MSSRALTSASGTIPPTITGTSSPRVGHGLHHPGSQSHVSGVVHRQADRVGVLLLDRGYHGFGGLAQAQVDDLHAGVAQHAGHHLESPVVAVEAEFGQHHPDGDVSAVVAHAGSLPVVADEGILLVVENEGILLVVENEGILLVVENEGILLVVENEGILLVVENEGSIWHAASSPAACERGTRIVR